MSGSKVNNTTLHAVADFCLIPMGLPTPSVGPQIAECQKVLERSGLEYKVRTPSSTNDLVLTNVQLHGYGTNVEGPWDRVMKAIGECHEAVHAMGTPRIAVGFVFDVLDAYELKTDIRIGTRTDRDIVKGGNDNKVKRVEEILSAAK